MEKSNGTELSKEWWANVLSPSHQSSAGGYRGDKVSQLATEYQMAIPELIDCLVDDINDYAVSHGNMSYDRKELTSMVCADFRNVLNALQENPYVITTLCEAIGIESNIKG